jgi:hypothetical protein
MNDTIFWVALAAYGLHILEEFFYDWKNWAQRTLKLPVNWDGFYVCNVIVLFLGLVCASINWQCPVLALTFPGLMLINAVCFHIMPIIITKRFSPGVITACLLFLPVCYFAFEQAIDFGVPVSNIFEAIGIGALLMAFPIILLKTKDHRFFNQKN